MRVAGTGFEPLRDSTRKRPDPPNGGAQSGALSAPPQNDPGIDAGLIAVIQAWPHLPEAIRAGILAMVRASH